MSAGPAFGLLPVSLLTSAATIDVAPLVTELISGKAVCGCKDGCAAQGTERNRMISRSTRSPCSV
jgi:hypothetical protein